MGLIDMYMQKAQNRPEKTSYDDFPSCLSAILPLKHAYEHCLAVQDWSYQDNGSDTVWLSSGMQLESLEIENKLGEGKLG